jgi:hypothetical protein
MIESHSPLFNWWRSTTTDPKWKPWFELGAILAASLFMVMQLAAGVIRWVLDMVGGAVLTYIPNAFMLLCILFVFSCEIYYARLRHMTLAFLIWVLLCLLVGIYNTGSPAQAVFALWVLLPFFFGLSVGPILMKPHPLRPLFYVIVFVVAVGGVLVHDFVALPWVGVSYQVGGVELEGAREWHASGGKQRLSGFARSSFDVAGQILVAAGLLSLCIKNAWVRLALWSFCAFAISLSTSKGILLTLFMAWLASESLIRRNIRLLQGIFILGIIWLILPPVMGWTMDWSQAARVDIDHPLYGSFIDRMNDMWPRALDLATEHGVPLLGRGLGGIGVPLSIFEPAFANAGDNLWVYMAVIGGIFSIPILIAGYMQIFKLCRLPLAVENREILILAVIVNWYGGVSNILEHAVLALIFGIVCRYLITLNGIANRFKNFSF